MSKKGNNGNNRAIAKILAFFGAIGIIILIVWAEIASDIGNAIVAFLGLKGKDQGILWLVIAGSVGAIALYVHRER